MTCPSVLRRIAVLALTLPLLAGCGGDEPAAKSSPTAAYDEALHDALPAGVRARGALRIATDAAYPPAEMFGPDGRTIIGFEPEIGAALGRVLGVEVRFVQTDFSSILTQLKRHRVELVMSAMTDTPEREREVDFINYFSAGTSIVVQRGNPSGVSDLRGLCGRTVAVEESTTQVDLLARSQDSCGGQAIRVRTYDSNADALVQLRTGRADAVLNDYPPAAYLASKPSTRARYQLASTTQYEPGLYGVAVARDQAQLRDAVQRALNRVMKSGEYAKVLRKWDVADGAVPDALVNGG